MKGFTIAVGLVALGVLLSNYVLNAGTRGPAPERPHESSFEQIDLQALQTQLTLLTERLDFIESQLSNSKANDDNVAQILNQHSETLVRLSELDPTLKSIASISEHIGARGSEPWSTNSTRTMTEQFTSDTQYQPNGLAESAFSADSGTPLDQQSQAIIAETFHSAEWADLHSMDCRTSICKITYSQSTAAPIDGVTDDDAELELIKRIGSDLGEDNLDIRFARDEQGNDVMYVQIR